jgi:RHS repeat-associated protein
LTNAAGTETGRAEYRPFGEARGPAPSPLTRYLYTDQEWDSEAGLYNYSARLYDPVLGRFTTPDSLIPDVYDPQGLNAYAYCKNSPLIYVDPTGCRSASDGATGDANVGDMTGVRSVADMISGTNTTKRSSNQGAIRNTVTHALSSSLIVGGLPVRARSWRAVMTPPENALSTHRSTVGRLVRSWSATAETVAPRL